MARLTALWCRVLDVDDVAPADDFFLLGGRSLDAATMLEMVDAEFATRIGLAQFLEHTTLNDLARQVRAARDAGTQADPRLVVRLQDGSPDRRPLVLIHPHGGSALSYLALVEKLPATVPVYGVMARGVESDVTPHSTIPDMADEYVAALTVLGLERHSLLAGWSFGAFTAFEMAVRLQRSGQAPFALLLFDPRLPAAPAVPGAAPPLHRQIQRTWHIEVDEAVLRDLTDAARYEHLLAAGIAQKRIPQDMTVDMLVRRAVVRDRNTHALLRYRTEDVFAGPTHIFLATDEGTEPHRTVTECWRGRLSGPVTFHEVPGTHGRLLKEPAVAGLAMSVSTVLAGTPAGG